MPITTYSIYSKSSATETSSGSFEYPQSLPSETFVISGSLLIYPLFSQWAKNFTRVYPNVSISIPTGGYGSEQQQNPYSSVEIDGSDTFLSNSAQEQYPSVFDIPLVVSAEAVIYNIPGLPQTIHLNFTGTNPGSNLQRNRCLFGQSADRSYRPGSDTLPGSLSN